MRTPVIPLIAAATLLVTTGPASALWCHKCCCCPVTAYPAQQAPMMMPAMSMPMMPAMSMPMMPAMSAPLVQSMPAVTAAPTCVTANNGMSMEFRMGGDPNLLLALPGILRSLAGGFLGNGAGGAVQLPLLPGLLPGSDLERFARLLLPGSP